MSRSVRSIFIAPSRWEAPGAMRITAREELPVAGIPLHLVTVDSPEPRFTPAPAEVIVRVLAFSCNYRDKSWSLHLASEAERLGQPFGFGSDFVGEVVAVGNLVKDLRPGDRVIGDNDYPAGGGLATQAASTGFLRFPQSRLIRVPATMDLDAAATFGVSAQTAYGMVRRSALGAFSGETRILLTAGTSSTSLALLPALRAFSSRLSVITTSVEKAGRLRELAAGHILTPLPSDYAPEVRRLLERTLTEQGGFTHVFDPFCDINLPLVLDALAPGGTYVTCGFFRQHNAYPNAAASDFRPAWDALITRNLNMAGNCLGLTADLEAALADHVSGKYSLPIDSVHPADRPGAFLQRTYNESGKFGKVSCRLNEPG